MLIDNSIFNKKNAYKYDLIKIDEEFAKEIISQIPSGLNNLEIALFVYIKLCKTFSYDEEYFMCDMGVMSKRKKVFIKHTKLSNILTINKDNNYVVCWEFVAIYGKILRELGIESYVYDIADEKNYIIVDEHEYFQILYGKWHPYFVIKVNNTFIDINVSAWYGDLSLAKNNYMLKNIKCLDENKKRKENILNGIKKAYSLISPDKPIESFEFYNNFENKNEQISLKEKIKIISQKIKESDLTGMDMLDYILLLSRQENRDNLNTTVIGADVLENGHYRPTIIFTLNNKSISNNPGENYYYVYYNGKKIMPISKEKIEEEFLNKKFRYFKKGLRISGIKEV